MRDDAGLDVDRAMLREVPDPSAPCVRPRGLLRGLLRGVLQRHALLVVLIGLVHSRGRRRWVGCWRFPISASRSSRALLLEGTSSGQSCGEGVLTAGRTAREKTAPSIFYRASSPAKLT